jgi:predicted GNAT family acetyltransferase
VYVYWLLASGQIGNGAEAAIWRDARGALAGFCYFGSQVVVSADELDTYERFAESVRHVRGIRQIVGPRLGVERFWNCARAYLRTPSAIRTSQPVYALTRDALHYSRADAEVAPATLAELDEIAVHSAQMIAGELGGAARSSSSELRMRTARIIANGWWWRYRVEGRLAFMCNVGSETPQTAQLQGVWTPPALRGKGYATRALGAICDLLLDVHPTLCLYVNDFNRAAIALYERVGFTRVSEFQTILFS